MSTVLLVENLPIVRAALRERLTTGGHQVVGEADNGQDALRMCRELQPEVVILELAIPRLGGLDVLRRLRASAPDIRLLVFSGQESEVYAGRSQQEGADAFVSKSEPVAELDKALAAVTGGRTYFPRPASPAPSSASPTKALKDELKRLSARELTVLQMLCQGLSNKEISDHLNLSYKTVATYKVRLHQKLGVDSDFQLIKVARIHGLDGGDAISAEAPPAEENEELGLLRALLDSTPTPMFVRDTQGRLLLCNQPYLRRADSSFEALRGTRIEEAHWLPPGLRERAAERYREAVRRQEPLMLEVAVDQVDGPKTLYVWFLPHRSPAGELLAMVGGVRPLGERDSMLAELRHESLAAQYRSHQKSAALQLIRDNLAEQLASLRSHAVETGALAPCIAQLALTSAHIDELLALEDQDANTQRAACHLGQLTADLLVPIRHQLEAAGYSLDLGPGLRSLKAAWINAAQYRYLLESLFHHIQLLQSPCEISLHLDDRPYPRGYLRLFLTLSPWPPALPGTGDATRAIAWSQARIQRALAALSAASQVTDSEAETPSTLQIHLDLPLAMDMP